MLVLDGGLLLATTKHYQYKPSFAKPPLCEAGCFVKKMNYTVYIHTFPNGKKYVGVTGQTPEKRWKNGQGYKSQPQIYRAIEKYGWENVSHDASRTGLSKEAAYEMEVELIAKYDTTNPDKGYNNSIGGVGGSLGATLSETARKNIAKGHIGLKLSPETKRKLSEGRKGENNPNYGKHPSQQTIEKYRESIKTSPKRDQMLQTLSLKMKERWKDEAYRKYMAEVSRRAAKSPNRVYLSGPSHPNYGKHLTKEQKYKMASKKTKAILCVETGIIYPSAKFAEQLFGVSSSAIFHALNKPNKTSCGFHWERINNG